MLIFLEFKGFFNCIGKSITESEFKNQILEKYCSSTKGLTLNGFIQFWGDSTRKLGEETVFGWLEELGYDRSLFSMRSRVFILSIHRYQITKIYSINSTR
jgi:hypothetical protein